MSNPNAVHLYIVSRRAAELILEANAGRWPATVAECVAVAARFGAVVQFHPAESLGPYGAHYRAGVIYIPIVSCLAFTLRMLIHEIAEVVTRWDGEPPYKLPGPCDGLEHHRCACMVEEGSHCIHPGRRQ